MATQVKLTIKEGAGAGKTFTFLAHDTFILGRNPDSHVCIPDDPQVSRHHFLLEVCPPDASLRDLGSLNGTHVNGACCGGRKPGETPEQGAKRSYPEVALKHGDRIRVGRTSLEVGIEIEKPKNEPPPQPPPLPNAGKLSPDQVAAGLLALMKAKAAGPSYSARSTASPKPTSRASSIATSPFRIIRNGGGDGTPWQTSLSQSSVSRIGAKDCSVPRLILQVRINLYRYENCVA